MFDAGAIVGQMKLRLNEWTQNVTRVKKDAADIRSQLGGVATQASNFGRQLTAGLSVAAVGLMARSFVQAASTAENYGVRLRVMLGSQEKANQLFRDMSDFAGKVTFEYEEIMGAATTLSGIMRGGAEEVKAWMPLIADVAAATGLGIQETTSQIVRMYSAGAASADLFRERGVLAMMGFQVGVSYSAEETRRKLVEAWKDPQSKFKGAADELSKTWTGALSMISDKWFEFRRLVMDAGVFDGLKSGLQAVNRLWDANREGIQGWIADHRLLIQGITLGTPTLMGMAAAFYIIRSAAVMAFSAQVVAAAPLVGALVLIVTLVESWRVAIEDLGKTAPREMKAITSGLRVAYDGFAAAMAKFSMFNIAEPDVLTKIKAGKGLGANSANTFVKEFGSGVKDQFAKVWDKTVADITGIMQKGMAKIQGVFGESFNVDGMDTKALDALAMQLEALEGFAGGGAAAGLKELAETGVKLYDKLDPVVGLMSEVTQSMDALKAAGLLTQDVAEMLGASLVKGFAGTPEMLREAIAEIRNMGEAGAVVAQGIEDEMKRVAGAEGLKVWERILPASEAAVQQIKGDLQGLADAGKLSGETLGWLAQDYWNQWGAQGGQAFDAIIRKVRELGPEFENAAAALERLATKNDMTRGRDLFKSMSGIGDTEELTRMLTDLEGAVLRAKEAGELTPEASNILAENLARKVGEEYMDWLYEALDLFPALKAEIGDLIPDKTAEDLRDLAAGLNDIGGTLAGIGNTVKNNVVQAFGKTVSAVGQFAQGLSAAQSAFKSLQSIGKGATGSVLQGVMGMASGITGAIGAVASLGEAFGLFGDDAEKELKGIDRLMADIQDAMEGWIDELANKLVEAIQTGKFAFQDFLSYLTTEIATLATKAVLMDLFGMAKGGVVEGGKVQAYGRGGVVREPKLFAMADGLGLMGESGPEAVMPLKRLPSGRLGVEASGGGVTVNVHDHRSQGEAIEVQESRGADGQVQLDIVVRDAIKRVIGSGSLDRTLGLRYGLQGRAY